MAKRIKKIIKSLIYILPLIIILCSRKTDLQIGVEAVKKGEYQKAIKALRKAVAKDSLNHEIHYNLSLAYAHLDSAEHSFKHFLKLDELGSHLKENSELKIILTQFLDIEPYPSSPILMAKMNQFKGSPSPDGELIAVAAAKVDIADIYLVKYDGEVVKRIAKGGRNTDPVFSPAGDKIAFVSDQDGDDEIYIYDLKSQKTDKLTDNQAQDFLPSFSPNGKELAFVSNMDNGWEIYKMAIATKRCVRLTKNRFWDGFPAWTPDAKAILFSSKRDGSDDIYIMSASGGGETILYSSAADETDPHLIGENLIFRSNRDGEWEIYKYNLKNRLLVRLTNNPYPDWNPRVTRDGTRIILSRKIKNIWRLYFLNLSNPIPAEVIVQSITQQ